MNLKEELTAAICTKMEGKMEGLWSLSTSCLHNPLCLRNQSIPGSICNKCYAKALQEMRPALDVKGKRNAELLTKKIIPEKSLPDINVPYFRFEAFGDVQNKTQLINYIRIASHNPETKFALFTKNYEVAYDVLSLYDKYPSNMNLVISSLMINKPMNLTKFWDTHKFEKHQLKNFTVYNYDYLKEHPEIKINCGSRDCYGCHLCYSDKDICEVNEILKSDKDRVEFMEIYRDDTKRKEFIESAFKKLEELI